MDNINQIISKMKKLGFRMEHGSGSRLKVYPTDKNMPFYSLHLGEKSLHPLKRFSRKNWNLDLEKL